LIYLSGAHCGDPTQYECAAFHRISNQSVRPD
jgi:hypothetical protein